MDGEEIEIVIERVGTSRLNTKQLEVFKDMDVKEGYEAYVLSNGIRISDFGGGNVSVVIPFVLAEGTKATDYGVYYAADDGELIRLDATYDSRSLCFVVTHFSDYVVVYEGGEDEACPKDDTCPIAQFLDTTVDFWWHDGIHPVRIRAHPGGMGRGDEDGLLMGGRPCGLCGHEEYVNLRSGSFRK